MQLHDYSGLHSKVFISQPVHVNLVLHNNIIFFDINLFLALNQLLMDQDESLTTVEKVLE